jgi:hypothetical protein
LSEQPGQPGDDAPGEGPPWTEQVIPEPAGPQGHPTRAADVMPLVDKEIA